MKHLIDNALATVRAEFRMGHSPEYVARGVAIGVWIGFCPIIGQMPVAALLATVSKGARVLAVLLVNHSNPITWPFYAAIGFLVGHRLRGKTTLAGLPEGVELPTSLSGFGTFVKTVDWVGMFQAGGDAYLSVWVGLMFFALILTPASYVAARWYMARRKRLALPTESMPLPSPGPGSDPDR